jgi:succinylarginine dihydrolase
MPKGDYGYLPPKKLARMKALVNKGLEEHVLSPKERYELVKLYREAGGEGAWFQARLDA